MTKFLKLLKSQEGATAIEYGLIAALIAVAAIGAMQGIGNKLNTTFNNVSNSLHYALSNANTKKRRCLRAPPLFLCQRGCGAAGSIGRVVCVVGA
jgi:pilus assembly protein Flp/PilA